MYDDKLQQNGLHVSLMDDFVRKLKMVPRRIKLAPLSFKNVQNFEFWSLENVYNQTISELKEERDTIKEELERQPDINKYAYKLTMKLKKINAEITNLEGKWEVRDESKKANASPKLKNGLDEAKGVYQQIEGVDKTHAITEEDEAIATLTSQFQSFNQPKNEPIVETTTIEQPIEEKKVDIDQYLNKEYDRIRRKDDGVEPDMNDQLEERREEVETFKNELAQGRVTANDSYDPSEFLRRSAGESTETKQDAMDAISRLLPEYQEIMAPVFEAERAKEEDLTSLQDADDELKGTMEENHKIIEMNKDANQRLNYMREVLIRHAEQEKARIARDRERIKADEKSKREKTVQINENIDEKKKQFANTSKELADLEDAFQKLGIPLDQEETSMKKR